MHIKEITFNENLRTIKAGLKIPFNQSITVISGDNGSGKSTIIQAIFHKIASRKKKYDNPVTIGQDVEHSDITIDSNLDGDDVIYLDSVSGLLKTLSYFDDDSFDLQLYCMHKSAGEGLLAQLAALNNIENLHNKLLILDEPERGLSIKQQIIVANYLRLLVERNSGLQIIIVTHAFGFLTESGDFETIFCTNNFEYMSASDYISGMFFEAKKISLSPKRG